jgi:hypothetical protein
MSTTFDMTTGELIDDCETPSLARSRGEELTAPRHQVMLALQTLDTEARSWAHAALPPQVLLLDVERLLETCN